MKLVQAGRISVIYIYGSNYENILHFHSSLFFLACLLIWLVDNDFQTVFNSLTLLWVFNGFGVGFLYIFRSLLYIFKKNEVYTIKQGSLNTFDHGELQLANSLISSPLSIKKAAIVFIYSKSICAPSWSYSHAVYLHPETIVSK